VLFLLNNFGLHFPLGRLISEFWPLILIFFGVMNILRATAVGGGPRAQAALYGGVMMVTVGGLFLLQNIGGIGFGRTWPLLLIAAGLLGVMRFSGVTAGGARGGGFGR
ncbi:MAG: hypothetical protein SGI92_12870, partial [Bryobacteraceae bacterium]|nr:hypothetical protein [Bryobacteraceae bacterium]